MQSLVDNRVPEKDKVKKISQLSSSSTSPLSSTFSPEAKRNASLSGSSSTFSSSTEKSIRYADKVMELKDFFEQIRYGTVLGTSAKLDFDCPDIFESDYFEKMESRKL